MKYRRSLTMLSWVIVVLSAVAASAGIFSSGGPGPYQIESVRGKTWRYPMNARNCNPSAGDRRRG
ncbi:MAG: hypothetical protein U5K31_09525 [Balneolaceae bacterium]|nr:hypothetical protein [Balneolaceae bacterium]